MTIAELAALGYEIIPIDALPQRLSRAGREAFAVVTLDDGYRDNVVHALPVFERHAAPFTVFACTGFIRRTHSMWWETALALVRSQAQLALDFGEGAVLLPVTRDSERQRAFDVIGRAVMQGDEARAIAVLDAAARKAGIDPLSFVDAQILDESELQALARHPLATIGAHSVSHRAMARLSPAELYEEISVSRQVLTDLLGMAPSAFAFPYGHHAQAGAARLPGLTRTRLHDRRHDGADAADRRRPKAFDGPSAHQSRWALAETALYPRARLRPCLQTRLKVGRIPVKGHSRAFLRS